MNLSNFFIFKKQIKKTLNKIKKKNFNNKKIIIIGNSKKV